MLVVSCLADSTPNGFTTLGTSGFYCMGSMETIPRAVDWFPLVDISARADYRKALATLGAYGSHRGNLVGVVALLVTKVGRELVIKIAGYCDGFTAAVTDCVNSGANTVVAVDETMLSMTSIKGVVPEHPTTTAGAKDAFVIDLLRHMVSLNGDPLGLAAVVV